MGFYGSQPKTPDPKETAAAQTGTNIGTAIANNVLGQVNQVTPDGSLTYSQSGTYKWTDPLSGKVYDLPKTTATQTLSEMQGKIKTQEDNANLNMATLGADQSKRLNEVLSKQFDPKDLPTATDWSKMSLPEYTKYGGGPNLKDSFETGGDITKSYGTDFSADRQKVEDALMARLNPQLDRDREALGNRLAAQGLQPGSEAYNRAIDEASRASNDARYGAILAGGEEQSRMTGLERDRAIFENAAQQQGFTQNQGLASFFNDANQMEYDNNMRTTAGNNQLQDSKYNAAITKGTNVDNSRSRALQEAYAMRQQPINEIAALLQGGQVSMPQFMNLQGAQMPTVDYSGLVQQDYQNKMGQYQNNQANIGGLLGGLASFFM